MKETIASTFETTFGRRPEVLARAPGRIEFIGNHTDYNGGLVMGASIDRGITVALARRDDGRRRFASDYDGAAHIEEFSNVKPVRQNGRASWTNYPLGVLDALPAFELEAPDGFDYLAVSDLPTGSGLSSSAAIELASALAFLAVTGQQPPRETIVKAARYAENNFVGVPCGILDQGVSGFGQADHLVVIDCSGPTFRTVPLPDGVHFWVFNTHTRHALVDGLYAARHRECMEAAKVLGVSKLAMVSPHDLARASPGMGETIRKRAQHVIEEIARVRMTVAALSDRDLSKVGGLLTASHRSSQHLFENSTPELDFLVDALAAASNVYGARLSGGGFGGAVMAMTDADFSLEAASRIAATYQARFGAQPDVLHMRTSDGARML